MPLFRPSFVALALCAHVAAAAEPVPVHLQHSGRLVDGQDAPVTTPVSLEVTPWDAQTGGAAVWSETRSVTPHAGVYALLLGDTEGGHEALTSAHLDGERWLSVAVDGVELEPRHRLGVVPHAAHARFAAHATQADHAKTADHATNADKATHALAADHAATADKLGTLAPADVALSGHDHDDRYLQKGATGAIEGDLSTTGHVSATQFASTAADGTAPFSVTSTTKVDSLNADLLDGLHADAFARSDDPRLLDGERVSVLRAVATTAGSEATRSLTINGVKAFTDDAAGR